MRIIAGSLRGRRLKTLPGAETRPSAGKVREAVFSSLQALVPASTCLDLCAGSGSMGIEALSRGAEFCYFVDNSPRACEVVRANLATLALGGRASVLCMDAEAACRRLARQGGMCIDIAFLDPPYAKEDVYRRSVLAMKSLLRPGAVLVIEHSPQLQLQVPYQYIKTKIYGSSAISYYRNGGD
jgi:16S rRNA (guanine966-N2)-methyltransferase